MKIDVSDVLIEPVITEKVAGASAKLGKYTFRVHSSANKKAIKSAVEKIFNVHVTGVNTMTVNGKWKRVRYQPGQTADWKKAVVTLKKGEKLDISA